MSKIIGITVGTPLNPQKISGAVDSVNGKIGTVELTAEDVGALSQDKLQEGVNSALTQAKEGGEFDGQDGKDGSTPYINNEGNWQIGEQDTGVKAAGIDGQDGKSGVQISTEEPTNNAVNVWINPEGIPDEVPDYNYTLSEEEKREIAEEAAKLVEVPEFKLLDTFDLSSGALRYEIDTSGCTEIITVHTSQLTYSSGHIGWKGIAVSYGNKNADTSSYLRYLGDGVVAAYLPRIGDKILNGESLQGVEEANNCFFFSCSSATEGIIKVFGR